MTYKPNFTVLPFNQDSIVRIFTPEEPNLRTVSEEDQNTPYVKVTVYDSDGTLYGLNIVSPTFKVVEDADSGLTYLLVLGEAAFKDVGETSEDVAAGDHTHTFTFTDLVDTPDSFEENKYLRSTSDGLEWVTISGGSAFTGRHEDLIGLDFDSSGHTGFVSVEMLTTVSGTLQTEIDNINIDGGVWS